MIDQRLHALQEANGVRQRRVPFKGGLVHPARMHIEQSWISYGAIVLNGPAARLLTCRTEHISQHSRDVLLLPLLRIKAGENEHFHV